MWIAFDSIQKWSYNSNLLLLFHKFDQSAPQSQSFDGTTEYATEYEAWLDLD